MIILQSDGKICKKMNSIIIACTLILCLFSGISTSLETKFVPGNAPRYCGWNPRFGHGGYGHVLHANVTYESLFVTNTNDMAFLDIETGAFIVTDYGHWEISYTYEVDGYDDYNHSYFAFSEVYLMYVDGSTGIEIILDRNIYLQQTGIISRTIDTSTQSASGGIFYLKANMMTGYLNNVMICFVNHL